MIVRFIFMGLFVVLLAGCATTQQGPSPMSQLQNQVVDLEKRMEEQEKNVVDLKYEVKEVSDKQDAKQVVDVETSALNPTPEPVKATAVQPPEGEAAGLIKVAASPEDVQKALKNAGVYTGKIDGKVGSRTKSAVMEFQRQHNLRADGVIGQKTWAALKTYLEQ